MNSVRENNASYKGSEERVLHWCFLNFWTLYVVQYSEKHNIPETGSVPILR
jgi:hypothetical protein